VLKTTPAPGPVLIKNIHSWSCSGSCSCKSAKELLPESTPVLRILHTSAAKVFALFLKLFFLFIFSTVLSICLVRMCFHYLRIADIMLIISVIAV